MENHRRLPSSAFDVNFPFSPFTTSPQHHHSTASAPQTLLDDFALFNISSHDHHSSPNTNLIVGPMGPPSHNHDRQNQVFSGVGVMWPQNHHVGPLYKGSLFDYHPYSNVHESTLNLQQSPGFIYSTNNERSNLSNLGTNGGYHSLLFLAKDQQGCQMLMDMMDGLKVEEISLVFSELIGHVKELMVDRFGIYVFQKMLEICSEEQRTKIILMLTRERSLLLHISRTMHGSRAVQQLLQHVTRRIQLNMIISALTPAVVPLAKDVHAHYVVQRCMELCTVEQNRHFLNEVVKHSFELATDKNGYTVLLQCFNHADGAIKNHLISEILPHCLKLAQDPFGNYVLQRVISLRIAEVTECMMKLLQGHFIHLSCNKFASNVVEKLLNESGKWYSEQIIFELLREQCFPMLLVDQYGNFVIKSALSASEGQLHDALWRLIKQNISVMRGNRYGRKLLEQVVKLDLKSPWHV